MSNLDYIDNYFKGLLSSVETKAVEEKITSDPAFAEELAFYYTANAVIKTVAEEEKKNHFRKIYEAGKHISNNKATKNSKGILHRIWSHVAAAAIVTALLVGSYYYLKPVSVQQLATNYIKNNFGIQGAKMSAAQGSMEAAIGLYNENKLPEALVQFEKIGESNAAADRAKKMAGIVSLRLQKYDKAIEYFTQLENLPLYSNPGKFYHALTLIKRNLPGDQQNAKQLLEQVVKNGLEGNETAKEWLAQL